MIRQTIKEQQESNRKSAEKDGYRHATPEEAKLIFQEWCIESPIRRPVPVIQSVIDESKIK
jgi:hypothetical protein